MVVSMPSKSDASAFSAWPGMVVSARRYCMTEGPGSASSWPMPWHLWFERAALPNLRVGPAEQGVVDVGVDGDSLTPAARPAAEAEL